MTIKTKLKLSTVLFSVFLVLTSGLGYAQSTGQIKGVVYNTESLGTLNGAIVTLENSGIKIYTDRNGAFTIRQAPLGEQILEISMMGFKTVKHRVTVSAGQVTNLDIYLDLMEIREEIIVVAKRPEITGTKNLLEQNLSNTEELLDGVEGIAMVKKGNTGFDPTIRGLNADRINITIDNVKIYGACRGRMDPATTYLEIGELENIEIIKGPNSVAMGTNNVGGTINLISKRPRQFDKFTIKGSAEMGYYSAANGKKGKLEFSGGSKHYGFRVNSTYLEYGDYRSGEDIVENSGFKRFSYGTYFDVYPDENKTIAFSLLGNLGRDTGFPALPMDSEIDDALIASVEYTQKNLGKNWLKLRSKFYFNKVHHVMNNKNRATYMMRQAEGIGDTRTFGGHFINEFAFLDALVKVGLDFYQTHGDTTRTVKRNDVILMSFQDWPNASIRDLGIFSEYSGYLSSRLQLRLGLRADFSYATAKEISTEFANFWGLSSAPSKHETGFSGNLSLTYQITDSLSISSSLARGNRKPGLSEYYSFYAINRFDNYDYIGSPELEDESNTNIDLQLKYESTRFHFKISGYRNMIHNYIVGKVLAGMSPKTMGASGVKVFDNLGKARITGIEANWIMKLFKNVHLLGNLSYTRGQDKENNVPLPEIPPFETSLGLKYNNSALKFWIQAVTRIAARQNRVSALAGEDETAGFNLFDLRFGIYGYKHFQIYGGIENIFNKTYHEHLNRNNILSPGRNIYLGIKTFL